MAVLLLGLHFFTEDPDCKNDTVNIFQFPDLSLSSGSEASMVPRRWDTTLGANTMTSYIDASALMKKQRIPPIVGWEAAEKILKQWLVVVTVLLGPQERHPAMFELVTLLEAADEVHSRLQSPAAVHKDMLASLVQLIQTEFNESLRQVFTSQLPVHWPHFTPLTWTLTTAHFHPDTITMLGGFRHNLPTAITPHQTTAPLYKAP